MTACTSAMGKLKILFHTLKIQIYTAPREILVENGSDHQKVLFQLYLI